MKYLTVRLVPMLALGLAVVAAPAFAEDWGGRVHHRAHHAKRAGHHDCYKCPKLRARYDTTEVIKETKDVDHSQTVNTQSVVPAKRLIETNHLIIHENEVRNTGTVIHNHVIVEKEVVLTKRNVDHKYVNSTVNLVQHKYNTQRQHVVEEREVPGEIRHLPCNCDRAPLQSYSMAPGYVGSRY